MSHDDRDEDYENDRFDELDEFEEYEESGMLRWLSIVFVVAALGGFVALAWYAYQSGMQPVSEDEIPMVAADTEPFKEKPEDPGGLQFDHQDKSVYNQLATGDGAERPMAERLLPPPEEPVERTQPIEPISPEDYAKEAVTGTTETIVETPIPSTPAKGDGASVEVVEVEEKPVAPEEPKEPGAEKETPALTVEEPVQKTETKSEPAVVETSRKPEPVAQPAPTPAPVVAQAGQYMAQLGAFGSQDDAVAAWEKIRAAHGSAFPTKTYKLQRADVNGKVFHRLQVGPFESETAARKVCDHLQKNNQACFIVSVK